MIQISSAIQNLETALKWSNGGEECQMPAKWAEETLALLREQTPQLITESRLMAYDVGFLDTPNEKPVEIVLITYANPKERKLTLVKRDGTKCTWDCADLGRTWRLWTAFPSEERRKQYGWRH